MGPEGEAEALSRGCRISQCCAGKDGRGEATWSDLYFRVTMVAAGWSIFGGAGKLELDITAKISHVFLSCQMHV